MSGANTLHSIEAEQAVLGGVMLDNSAFPGVASILGSASSFGHEPYRAVFAAIGALVSAHQPADPITVFERLRDAGQAEQCSLQHLNAIMQSVPGAANVRRYAAIVAGHALRRDIITLAESLPELVREAGSADEALDLAQAKLAALKRTKARGAPRKLGELVGERLGHIEALADGTAVAGMSTGLLPLDDALGGGLKPGQLITLAARTSVGKTSLAMQILLHAAGAGHPALILSQEMTGGELAGRALSTSGRIGMNRLATGRLEQSDWSALVDAGDALAGLPVFVDDTPALTLLDIRAKAREVQRRAGLSLLVVDYLQLCAGEGGREKSRHHQIEAISRGIKALAKELGVAVLLLSQLNRAAEDDEPELFHLKESGAAEEDADAVILLHPMGTEPDGSLLVMAKIAKNRGGRRGRLALSFDGRVQRWCTSSSDVSPRAKVRR